MSIKDFHILFIFCSILLSIGFGVWALNNYGQPATLGLRLTALGSFSVAVLLTIYGVKFIKKVQAKI